MIKTSSQLRLNQEPNLKGGRKTTRIINILEQEELHGAGRLFAVSIIPPGGSIGRHTHSGDFETYYILRGRALADDNGSRRELGPGDVMQCRDGEYHSIENIGDTDLEYFAVILYS